MDRHNVNRTAIDTAQGGWPSWPWLLRIGRWKGEPWTIDLRFLCAVVLAWGCVWLFSMKAGTRDLTLLAGMSIGVGIVSVILFEVAKSFARFAMRVQPQEIVLGPLGNLVENLGSHEPRKDVWATVAGLAFSALLSVGTGITLVQYGQLGPTIWLGPLPVPYLDGYSGLVTLGRLAMWINGLLVVINLLPIGPLAGRTLLIAIFRILGEEYPTTVGPVAFSDKALLASDSDLLTAAERTSRTALAIAAALASFGLAMAIYAPKVDELIPGWAVPVVLSTLVLFAAMRDRYALRLGVNVDRLPSLQRSGGAKSRQVNWEKTDPLPPGYSNHPDDASGFSDELISGLHAGPFDSSDDEHRDIGFLIDPDHPAAEEDAVASKETWVEGTTSATNPHRLDEILQKLHDGGMAALTEAERIELDRASRVFRERRQSDPKKGLK